MMNRYSVCTPKLQAAYQVAPSSGTDKVVKEAQVLIEAVLSRLFLVSKTDS